MRFTFGLMVEITPINVIFANQCYNQSTAFMFVFQETVCQMLWDMKFIQNISTFSTAFATKKSMGIFYVYHRLKCNLPAGTKFINTSAGTLLLYTLLFTFCTLTSLSWFIYFCNFLCRFLVFAHLFASTQFATTFFDSEAITTLRFCTYILGRFVWIGFT